MIHSLMPVDGGRVLGKLEMQGLSEVNRELPDASARCRQHLPNGSVEVFLADHR